MSICKVEMDLGLESGEKLIGTHPEPWGGGGGGRLASEAMKAFNPPVLCLPCKNGFDDSEPPPASCRNSTVAPGWVA